MTVNRSAKTMHRVREVPGETEIAHAARLLAVDMRKRLDRWAKEAEKWWNAQLPRTRVGLAIIALVVGASFLNVIEIGFARGSASQPAAQTAAVAAPSLHGESAPADAGKVWSVARIWQGSGTFDTESFTVADHWRVDWLYNQTQSVGGIQIYVYSVDGRLLNVAGNSAHGGSDTTFWMGPGTYTLKINATGGDWKVDVQDLH